MAKAAKKMTGEFLAQLEEPAAQQFKTRYHEEKKAYLAEAAKAKSVLNVWYRELRKEGARNEVAALNSGIASERVTLSIYKEKRDVLSAELAKLDAVPAEPASLADLRKELASLTANREALKARNPGLFDPATRSAVAMEKVLLELIDLRAEVKRLRDGK